MRRHGERDHGRAGQHGHDAEGDPPDPRRSQAQAHGTAPYAAIVPGTLPQAGGKTFTACFTLVRPYGDLVSNVESPWEDAAVTATHNRNLRVSFTWMPAPSVFGWPDQRERQRSILEQAAAPFDAGDLRVHVGATF